MKKLLAVLALALILLAAGCENKEEAASPGVSPTAPATTTSFAPEASPEDNAAPPAASLTPYSAASPGFGRDNPLPMGQALTMPDGIEITVLRVVKGPRAWGIIREANRYNEPPAAGMQYIIVTIKVRNISSEGEPATCGNIIQVGSETTAAIGLIGSSDREIYGFEKAVVLPYDGDFTELRAELYHGDETTGSLCFYIPEDETGLNLVWHGYGEGGNRYLEVEPGGAVTGTDISPSDTTSPAAATQTTPSGPDDYTLEEALGRGLIEVRIKGSTWGAPNGASSGDIIEISFLRKVPEILKIIVPPGTLLISNDSAKQDMVILRLSGRDPSMGRYIPEEEIILDGDGWAVYLFEAYCLELEKDNILSSTTFTPTGTAPEDIMAVLNAADSLGEETASVIAIQVAIWALTDNPTLENLIERYVVDDRDLVSAWIILDKAGLDPGSKKMFTGYTQR